MLIKYQATPPTLTDKQAADFQVDQRGSLLVTLAPQGSAANPFLANNVNGVASATTTINLRTIGYGYAYNGATWDQLTKPNLTARLLSSAATTNSTNVKASAGNVHKITGNNTVAVKKYLKLYNKATAPTVGTDTPVLTFVIPVSAAFSFDLADFGTYFSTGIAYAITGAAADADATAIGAGDIECLNIIYS